MKALTAQQNSLSPSTSLKHLFLKPNTTKTIYAYTPQRGEHVVNVKTIFSPGANRGGWKKGKKTKPKNIRPNIQASIESTFSLEDFSSSNQLEGHAIN